MKKLSKSLEKNTTKENVFGKILVPQTEFERRIKEFMLLNAVILVDLVIIL